MQRYYGRLLFTSICSKNQTYTVASAPAVTGSVNMQRFTLFFGTVQFYCEDSLLMFLSSCFGLNPIYMGYFLDISWHFQNRQFISPSACKNSLKRLERMVNMADKHHNVNKKLMPIIHLYVMKDIWLNSKYQAVSKLSVLWYTRTVKL